MADQQVSQEDVNALPQNIQRLVHGLQQETEDLLAQIASQRQARQVELQQQALAASHQHTKPPKLQDPTTYDGTRNTRLMDEYIYDVKQHLLNDPPKFALEDTKIRFAGSFLKGLARTWFRTWDDSNERPWNTFEGFMDLLKEEFSELEPLEYWRKRWEALQQRSSITAYLAEFQSIAHHLDVTHEDKYHVFKKGLRSSVLDQLALLPKPDSLEELIKSANRIDQRIFEHQRSKGNDSRGKPQQRLSFNNVQHQSWNSPARKPLGNGYQNTNRAPSSSAYSSSTYQRPSNKASYPNNQPVVQSRWNTPAVGEDCMQLDSIHKGPLTEAERQRRLSNSLCLYCGKAGHIANACTLKQNRPQTKPKNY